MTHTTTVAVIGMSVLGLVGCSVERNESTGPTEHFTKTIELDKSEAVRVNLKMGAGEVRIRGGSANLMNADFEYNVPSWKPEVRYDNASFRGQLDIEQPGGTHNVMGNHHYVWNMQFNNDKPLSFNMELGAGEADLSMGSLKLQNVDVKIGVGKVDLDLRGTPQSDYQVSVHGGVGQADIHLPKGVGIVADAQGGIGSIEAKGLHKRGDRYVSDEYENGAKTTIRLNIEGGIGQINLMVD